jgi:hypothetical protein
MTGIHESYGGRLLSSMGVLRRSHQMFPDTERLTTPMKHSHAGPQFILRGVQSSLAGVYSSNGG